MRPAGLADPKMFKKPNTTLKRNLSDQTYSRLELFKECYIKWCVRAGAATVAGTISLYPLRDVPVC